MEPYDEEEQPVPTFPTRKVMLVIAALFAIFVIWSLGSQLIWLILNFKEFGELFLKPIYFEIIGGTILAIIAFVRLDILNRRSLIWWFISLIISAFKGYGVIPPNRIDFKSFKLTPTKFALWQITKVLLGMMLFRNYVFGMATYAMSQGWDPKLDLVLGVFKLPFITPPMDGSYAQMNVLPMIPALTLLLGPLLAAFGTRIVILVAITQFARIFTPTPEEASGAVPFGVSWRVASFEGVLSIGLFWIMFNSFFSTFIDYNTRYIIGGLAVGGILFAIFYYLDLRYSKGLSTLRRRRVTIRILSIFMIALVTGSIMAINNSVADARKVEWLGPYTSQQIAVNRYFAELDKVREVPYDISLKVTPKHMIEEHIADNRPLLNKIRLWDWEAAFAKLKPEIGLIPYVDYQDSDILRFNNTLYWSSSMKPILPETVLQSDQWYAEHLVYTHVPNGFFILNANEGVIEDADQFFKQRKIYYGEGGLLSETWATYPQDREKSEELGGYFYSGNGGVSLSPPLSWIFEFNFFLAYRTQTLEVLRYRDIYDRIEMLFPYFEYDFSGKKVDMFPVTDGVQTYYLMPLIVRLDTGKVPWGSNNPLVRLAGYALIDIYNGDIKIFVIGDDFFSELFKDVYSEYITTDIPEWLELQTRYPEELFEWRVGMFNYYHVTDPATFIIAKEFFEVPEGLDSYYIVSKTPDFDELEFVGLLSLELRGAKGRNLAGYMVVENDYSRLGVMTFNEVSLEQQTKLLGPTATREALEKNAKFATLRTLLRTPRIGDNILYRVGENDVYFIPVYTAGAGGVVTELGVVACVGALFTGEYYVGLGDTAEEAYREYLVAVSKTELPMPEVPAEPEENVEERIANILNIFEKANVTLMTPEALNPPVSYNEWTTDYVSIDQWNQTRHLVEDFISDWAIETDKILMWQEGSTINFGVFLNIDGITELHYVTVNLQVEENPEE